MMIVMLHNFKQIFQDIVYHFKNDKILERVSTYDSRIFLIKEILSLRKKRQLTSRILPPSAEKKINKKISKIKNQRRENQNRIKLTALSKCFFFIIHKVLGWKERTKAPQTNLYLKIECPISQVLKFFQR